MSPRELIILHTVHVASVLVLVAYIFYAFAAAPETRKGVLAVTGVAALLVFATGFRMWQGLYGFAALGWIFVKMGCWLGLSALAGFGYRRRQHAGVLMLIGLILAVTAVAMVYVKPF